jgi:hypothetical protein
MSLSVQCVASGPAERDEVSLSVLCVDTGSAKMD